MSLPILYAFAEPLPLNKARGLQVAHTTAQLAAVAGHLNLAYVPAPNAMAHPNPHAAYGIEVSGIDYYPLARTLPPPLSFVHSNHIFAWHLMAVIRQCLPKVIYVRHLKLAALLLKKIPHIPLIYEAHEVFHDTASAKKREVIQQLEASVVTRVTALVTNSQATAARLQALYRTQRPCKVLPNGVIYPDALSVKAWAQLQTHILYSGSFFGWKGVDDLITAASYLPVDYQLTLLGGQKTELKLPESGAQLIVLPRAPQQAVMQQLAQSCIAVLPNRPDPDSQFTSPIKLFEYMAAGCAIVASDLPAIREVLADDEAAWFTAGDPVSLSAAIQALVANPQRAQAMGAKVREKAKQYTWQARAVKQYAFIKAVVTGELSG